MLREITFDSKKVPTFLDGAINAMALYKQTGIINKFDKCTVTAPIDYTTTGYGTITFNDGAIVICGRVVYIEAGTTLAIPITTTAGGSIGVKVDLNQNAGSQVAFYSKTTQTLTQQDLNENKTDGIYEFEIFKYTSNGTTLVLTYQTASVFDANETIIDGIIDGTLKVGSAENAENAILNNDTTYSALTTDTNGVLKVDDKYIITKLKVLMDTEPATAISMNSFNVIFADTKSLKGRKFKIDVGTSPSYIGVKYSFLFRIQGPAGGFSATEVDFIVNASTANSKVNAQILTLRVDFVENSNVLKGKLTNVGVTGIPFYINKLYEVFE